MSRPHRRPRLALPFTILTDRDTVRLVAGEDFRYTLTGPGLSDWLPDWLTALDGRVPLEEALGQLAQERREPARQLVDRLYGERVLIDGTALAAHVPARWRLRPEGSAAWAAGWQPGGETPPPNPLPATERGSKPSAVSSSPPLPLGEGVGGEGFFLPALCQDRLDHDEALRFNRRCLDTATPWLWASTGPMSRAYVSPLFLPDAGPCLSCLLYHFRRLSPVPELYDALTEHARSGRPIVPVPFPLQAIAIIQQLLLWKAALGAEAVPPAALYRLHVLEVASMEVTTHRVFVDPECPECGGRN
ncbi:MAG TPA: TOMM precursor leader peptide-binding protein [Gemmataceae bacterium]|nr:TOMM precursor leader peptide-binding protein [Gemmataceae bacterium]